MDKQKTIDQLNDEIMKSEDMHTLNDEDPTKFQDSVHSIYHAHGYDTEGKRLPLAQRTFGIISKNTGIPEAALQGAAAIPLPTAGALLGGRVAGAGGAAFGGYSGSKANELLGITDKMGTSDNALALLSPVAGPITSQASQKAASSVKWLPGAPAGRNELAGEVMEKSFSMARVTKLDVAKARADLLQVKDFAVPVRRTQKIFSDEAAASAGQAKEVPTGELKKYREDMSLMRESVHRTKNMTFKRMMALESGLIKMKSEGSDEVWTKASGELIGDMEDHLANPNVAQSSKVKIQAGLDAFRNVIKKSKQLQANDTLEKISAKVFQPVTGNTDLHAFNKKEFIRELDNNKILKGAHSPEDIKNMKDAVEHIGYLGGMNSMTSPQGIGGFIGRSQYPAAVGYAVGGQEGALYGYGVAAVLAVALTSQPGRNAVKYLAKQGRGKINGAELKTIMGQIISGTATAANAAVRAPSEGAVNAFENQE